MGKKKKRRRPIVIVAMASEGGEVEGSGVVARDPVEPVSRVSNRNSSILGWMMERNFLEQNLLKWQMGKIPSGGERRGAKWSSEEYYDDTLKLLKKMGLYDVKIHGTSVKVRVVDHQDLISLGLSELRSEVTTPTVVGLVVKESIMLQLCVGNRCLVILMNRLGSNPVPQCLKNFLEDQEICFVGSGVPTLSHIWGIECKSSVEPKELVARFLNKSDLIYAELARLAAEVGIAWEASKYLPHFNWRGLVFR
ncbi:hypothetical protein LOK49_LG03G03487 [Camellia lanceoleosa]|uniref:Uncharacterized protein n=1 Tax=Camellia lanceoleosa TaxID=1840588 RepID=A0ACC0IG02_9ERIC|nr:hypothetical protein LOK49_LG03G03487 [Camellia lanceoleosa]